jgi:integrase
MILAVSSCNFAIRLRTIGDILIAVITSDTLKAPRTEFDLETRMWSIPAQRMKASRDHRVPLCDRAIEIINSMSSPFPFANAKTGTPLHGSSMLQVSNCMGVGATVHGFRSAFRDWGRDDQLSE